MEPLQESPKPVEISSDGAASPHLLDDLASFTGLFNPELIWQTEQKLNDMDDASESIGDTGEPTQQKADK
jgi:hypothetical protein